MKKQTLFVALSLFPLFSWAAQLNIRITGFESAQGQVLISVFNQANGFPQNPRQALKLLRVSAQRTAVAVEVPELNPGNYAVAVVHDLNSNGKLDSNAFGMPTEPVGFSNNPSLGMSAPTFAECKLNLHEPDSSATIQLKKF